MSLENNIELFDTAIVPNSFPYRMRDVAHMLLHPEVNGRTKLFAFLNALGIFEGTKSHQSYVELGYFSSEGYYTKSGYYVTVTSISITGVKFIKELVSKELGEFKTPVKRSRKIKSKYPTINVSQL